MPDLPDYDRKVVVVYEGTITGGEIQCDHRKILGVALKSPSVAQSIPMSIENDAIAYDVTNDRFKVDVAAFAVGTIDADVIDRWARQVGQVDLARYKGTVCGVANPLDFQLIVSGAAIDPRIIRALTASDKITVDNLLNPHPVSAAQSGVWSTGRTWNLGDTDIPDLKDKAARLLGIAYGNKDQLQQRTTTKELIVQISHQGTEKDPTQIRALTSSDVITVADVTKEATPTQISLAGLNGNSAALKTPASGKKLRLKFISLEQSAAVDLGYRFGAAGTIYYLRTTAGYYLSNLIGCNNAGAADEAFYLNSSGATNVKGYILTDEV